VKIYVYPADRTGCGYFRLIWPAQALRAKGYSVEIMDPRHRAFNALVDVNTDKVLDVQVPTDADVIVLQRVTHRHIAESIPFIRAKGVGVVVDIDDDLAAIHPRHPAFVNLHPHKDPLKVGNKNSLYHNWHNTALACRDASIVTSSSQELHDRYANHGRGFVIRNYLPDFYLQVAHEDSDRVGWGGSVMSHPDDLDVLGRSVKLLIGSTDRDFHVIGPEWGVAEALNIDASRVVATGPVDMHKWPEALTNLGIGIAPLSDTRFNGSKSWLKPLEYAGLGIPCVMSPRREYREISKHGIGISASKPDQWFKKLRQLTTDDVYRRELGWHAREVAAQMTIPIHAYRWAEAWTSAYERP